MWTRTLSPSHLWLPSTLSVLDLYIVFAAACPQFFSFQAANSHDLKCAVRCLEFPHQTLITHMTYLLHFWVYYVFLQVLCAQAWELDCTPVERIEGRALFGRICPNNPSRKKCREWEPYNPHVTFMRLFQSRFSTLIKLKMRYKRLAKS